MKNGTGFKQMLRDRCPKVVGYALRWCKVKEMWLDHVYRNFIWVFSDKKLRLSMTRDLLGNNSKKMFVFEDTIDWDNLTKEQTIFWKNICSWVSWFQKEYKFIENEYSISIKKGYDIIDIKRSIMLNYLTDWCPNSEDDAKTKKEKSKKLNEFVDFLIDCFEDRI